VVVRSSITLSATAAVSSTGVFHGWLEAIHYIPGASALTSTALLKVITAQSSQTALQVALGSAEITYFPRMRHHTTAGEPIGTSILAGHARLPIFMEKLTASVVNSATSEAVNTATVRFIVDGDIR
jgi:hypothetical protein